MLNIWLGCIHSKEFRCERDAFYVGLTDTFIVWTNSALPYFDNSWQKMERKKNAYFVAV